MKSPALKGVLVGALALVVSGGGTFLLVAALYAQERWRPSDPMLILILIIMPVISILLGFSIAKRWRTLRIITTTLILLNIFIVVYFFVGINLERYGLSMPSMPFIPDPPCPDFIIPGYDCP